MKNKYKYAILIVVIAIIAILPCVYFMNALERFPLSDDSYQIINGMRINFFTDNILEKDDDKIYIKQTKESVLHFPIYYQNQTAFVLPQTMSVVDIVEATSKKINYFSKVYAKDNQNYVRQNDKDKFLKNCFLFDGEDMYIFLDDVKLFYGKKTVNISAFSYVKVMKNETIHYYDYKSQTFKSDKIDGSVTVQIQDKKVYLHSDILKTNDMQVLLYGNVSDLPNY